jgi:multidrug efflux pump subunit AcrB
LPSSRKHWQRPHEVIAGRAWGLSPLEAALTGSREIGFTIVSITLSRIAVLD